MVGTKSLSQKTSTQLARMDHTHMDGKHLMDHLKEKQGLHQERFLENMDTEIMKETLLPEDME